jgi:hypothetical protein
MSHCPPYIHGVHRDNFIFTYGCEPVIFKVLLMSEIKICSVFQMSYYSVRVQCTKITDFGGVRGTWLRHCGTSRKIEGSIPG